MLVHLVGLQVGGGPLSAVEPATHAPPAPHTFPAAEQSRHAPPPAPHVVVDWPPWHAPLESQHPLHWA